MSSRLASSPRSANTSRAAWISKARLRAASLRNGREAVGVSALAVMPDLPSVGLRSEYDTCGGIRVELAGRPGEARAR